MKEDNCNIGEPYKANKAGTFSRQIAYMLVGVSAVTAMVTGFLAGAVVLPAAATLGVVLGLEVATFIVSAASALLAIASIGMFAKSVSEERRQEQKESIEMLGKQMERQNKEEWQKGQEGSRDLQRAKALEAVLEKKTHDKPDGHWVEKEVKKIGEKDKGFESQR